MILSVVKYQRLFKIDFCILAFRARYGVQLEKGTFERRTADFLWMMIFGAISMLVSGSFKPLRSDYTQLKDKRLEFVKKFI
jgi:hypothetical protein